MTPNYRSFAHELELIKSAAPLERYQKIEKGDPLSERIMTPAGLALGGVGLGSLTGTHVFNVLKGLHPAVRIPATAIGAAGAGFGGALGGASLGHSLHNVMKKRRLEKKKEAAEKEDKPFKSKFVPMAKSRLGSMARFGIGAGIGAGTGMLAGEGLRKVWKKSTPMQRRLAGGVIGGMGVLGAMALWDAMGTAAKREEDAVK